MDRKVLLPHLIIARQLNSPILLEKFPEVEQVGWHVPFQVAANLVVKDYIISYAQVANGAVQSF